MRGGVRRGKNYVPHICRCGHPAKDYHGKGKQGRRKCRVRNCHCQRYERDLNLQFPFMQTPTKYLWTPLEPVGHLRAA
jgi:hypothetical protein